jgi:RNA polymerase sigma-54 factor
MQRVALPESLSAHLHAQIGVLRLSERESALAHALVEALDDDGYLRISLDEIVLALGENPRVAEGDQRWPCGACRRWTRPASPRAACPSAFACSWTPSRPSPCALARRILEGQIDRLAAQDFGGIARALGASPAEVQRAVAGIRRLNPRPGWSHGETGSRIVIADVSVKKVRGV